MKQILKQVYDLVNQENDEKTPYKTKYEANDLIVKYLSDNSETITKSEQYILKSIQAQIAYDTQEMYLCRKCLDNCEQYINPNIEYNKITEYVTDNHQLLLYILRGFSTRMAVLGNSDNYEEAIKFFSLGDRLYNDLIKNISQINENCQEEQIKEQKSIIKQINLAYTQFLFISAQIHSRAGKDEESAKLCRQTLQIQAMNDQYNYIEFSQHATDLSRYYINNRLFVEAWELLSCSSFSIAQALAQEISKSQQDNVESNNIKHQIAQVLTITGWIWYNIVPDVPNLTAFSKECLDQIAKDPSSFNNKYIQINQSGKETETPIATRAGERFVYGLPNSEQEALIKQLEVMIKEQQLSEKLIEQLNIFWRELGRFYLTVLQLAQAAGAQNNPTPASCKCRQKPQKQSKDIQNGITPWDFCEHNKPYELIHLLEQLSDLMLISIAHSESKLLITLCESASNSLKKALNFFLLDGWTTEHCKILLDLSYIYDILANYKPQNFVMYQQKRVHLFEALKGDLNPQYFNDIIEEFEIHLSEAKYDIFDNEYKKLLQINPNIESLEYQPKKNEMQSLQRASTAGANSVQQFQCLIIQIEKAAQSKCRCNRNLNPDAQIEWDSWIRCIDSESLESYIDAIFKQSVILSKFPTQTPKQRLQMMERSLVGFEYCEKVWKWMKASDKGEVDDNLKYVQEMMTLMRLRITQVKQLCQ